MARRLHLLFAALLTLLALAPGHAAANAQNPVGAFLSAAPTCTPADTGESPCTRPGSKPGSARITAGCCVATKAGPGAARGGETAATAYGRAIHKTFDYGPGFRREFSLPSRGRADAVNLRTREVVELKPNNPRAIALGRRQLDRYASELDELYPGTPFTRRLETYERP